jgi:hypothetical protein
MSRSNFNPFDSDGFPYAVLYLPTGECLKWSDTLEIVTVSKDFSINRLCETLNAGAPSGHVLSMILGDDGEQDYIFPVIPAHFHLVKR